MSKNCEFYSNIALTQILISANFVINSYSRHFIQLNALVKRRTQSTISSKYPN